MKSKRFATLQAEIRREIKNIDRLLEELKYIRNNLESNPTFIETRAMGSILHDFYCGVEKIFEHIAISIEDDIPKGENWHMELLNRMNLDIPDIRPHVIEESLIEDLKEYLRFRHLFRNIYGFELKWERFKELVLSIDKIWSDIKISIQNFFKFLEKI